MFSHRKSTKMMKKECGHTPISPLISWILNTSPLILRYTPPPPEGGVHVLSKSLYKAYISWFFRLRRAKNPSIYCFPFSFSPFLVCMFSFCSPSPRFSLMFSSSLSPPCPSELSISSAFSTVVVLVEVQHGCGIRKMLSKISFLAGGTRHQIDGQGSSWDGRIQNIKLSQSVVRSQTFRSSARRRERKNELFVNEGGGCFKTSLLIF